MYTDLNDTCKYNDEKMLNRNEIIRVSDIKKSFDLKKIPLKGRLAKFMKLSFIRSHCVPCNKLSLCFVFASKTSL